MKKERSRALSREGNSSTEYGADGKEGKPQPVGASGLPGSNSAMLAGGWDEKELRLSCLAGEPEADAPRCVGDGAGVKQAGVLARDTRRPRGLSYFAWGLGSGAWGLGSGPRVPGPGAH